MSLHHRSQRSDAFTILLFRLPAELRLQIYDYLIPKPSVRLLPESRHWNWELGSPSQPNRRSFRWLDTSRRVFLDAAPLFYSTNPLYFWIDARSNGQSRSLDDALRHHIKSAHPEYPRWAFEEVRSNMLTKVMLEVYAPTIGENLQSLLLRFVETTIQFRRYTALRELWISLRPHYSNAHHKMLFNLFKIPRLQEKTVRESWTMRRLCRAARQFKAQIPPGCIVKWYLPGETLPKVPYKRRGLVPPAYRVRVKWDLPGRNQCQIPCKQKGFGDTVDPSEVRERDLIVMEFMEALWAFVCERSDEALEDLLSERESQPAWRPTQSR